MDLPQDKLYLFQNELHTAQGLMQVAREIQVAHQDITRPENFDALLDHFYELEEPVIEIDPHVYDGATYDKKPIYKLIALVSPSKVLPGRISHDQTYLGQFD